MLAMYDNNWVGMYNKIVYFYNFRIFSLKYK